MGCMDMAQQTQSDKKNAGTRDVAGFLMGTFGEKVRGNVHSDIQDAGD